MHWDALAHGKSIFLSRTYLEALERHAPDGISMKYAMVFRGATPVAACVFQLLKVTGNQFSSDKKFARLETRALVCGNLLSWGLHGVAFAENEDPRELWPGVADAIYQVRRANRLTGQTGMVLVKDAWLGRHDHADALRDWSYRPVETDPDMILTISPDWRGYDDYVGSLKGDYRKNSQKLKRQLENFGCRLETISDMAVERDRIHGLYLQVHGNAKVKPVTLNSDYLPALQRLAGDRFRCTGIRRGEELLGFVTTIADGDEAIAYYIGYDRESNVKAPIYLSLLHNTVGDAVGMGCKTLSLGRTALEPKARLGAKPRPMVIWMRHRLPVVNVVIRSMLGAIPHAEAPERSVFK